jgi:hypothetical protein
VYAVDNTDGLCLLGRAIATAGGMGEYAVLDTIEDDNEGAADAPTAPWTHFAAEAAPES